jgi:hypothetical protein
MSSVHPMEQGIASGANNALREVGGALGIAVMSSIFASQGGYESAQSFVDGLRPALWVGAGVVAVAATAALAIPSARRTAGTVEATATAEPEEPALETAAR